MSDTHEIFSAFQNNLLTLHVTFLLLLISCNTRSLIDLNIRYSTTLPQVTDIVEGSDSHEYSARQNYMLKFQFSYSDHNFRLQRQDYMAEDTEGRRVRALTHMNNWRGKILC